MFSISNRPTIKEIHDLYRSKQALPSQVVEFFINRIEKVDKDINAFYTITKDLAVLEAKNCDQLLSETNLDELIDKYHLFGIPYSVKAIILVENEVFNASSKILDGYKAPYSSTVYKKCSAAKGIMMGINNMDQFAMGSSGENCDYGTTHNPFDLDRIPGGSSSGPAAAVASGQVVFSLGTDTGGSIRQPASFCDVVGLKPTYGLISRFGVIPMASSFDQVGAFSNNICDNIIVTAILSGQDKMDQTSIDSQNTQSNLKNLYNQLQKIQLVSKPLKIGIAKEFFIDGIDPVILAAVENTIEALKQKGHTIVDISLPLTKYAVSVYYMTMSVEVAANLERIDGVRYANQQKEYSNMYFEHRGKYFGSEPKRRIMLGTYASSSGYYDAFYNKAQKVRELARRDFDKAFTNCDVIITPTTPEFPFKIGEKTDDIMRMYLSDIFTCGINPVRIPGLTVPLGLFDNEVSDKKLPTGIQILSPELKEDVLFELGFEIEQIVRG
jgi:aspartyl-tRNA(Asn)/glutamyl-tRNA(Gln) amidotransferase subunit A